MGWRPDAALAPRVAIDGGVRVRAAGLTLEPGVAAAWTPPRALTFDEAGEQVGAVDVRARVGLVLPGRFEPAIAVLGGVSIRSYLAENTTILTAPVPVAGASLSARIALVSGLALVPAVSVQTDLRPVAVEVGSADGGTLSPVEVTAGVGILWAQKD